MNNYLTQTNKQNLSISSFIIEKYFLNNFNFSTNKKIESKNDTDK